MNANVFLASQARGRTSQYSSGLRFSDRSLRKRERIFTYPVKSLDGPAPLGPDSPPVPLCFLHCSVWSACETESHGELLSLAEHRLQGRDGKAHCLANFVSHTSISHRQRRRSQPRSHIRLFLICCSHQALW